MSGKGFTDKQWTELIGKVDKLVESVDCLQRDLKDWKEELIEEFSELTGLLVDHYQQVIDKHLLNKQTEDYFGFGQTIDSPSSGEDSNSTVTEEEDNQSKDSKVRQSDQLMDTDINNNQTEDMTNVLDSEID